MAYVSPIDRMAAMGGAVRSINSAVEQQQTAPLRKRMMDLQVAGQEVAQKTNEQHLAELDAKLRNSDIGARAYQLSQYDDETLMRELPNVMPEFYAKGIQQGARTPEDFRQPLNGLVNYAQSRGDIQTPQPKVPSLQSKAVQLRDGTRALAGFDPSTNTYYEQGTNRPYGAGEIQPIEAKGVEVNVGGEKQTVFQKKLEEEQAKQMSAFQAQAQEAVSQDFQLAQLEDLLNQGIPTGQLAGRLVGLKGLAADLGIDVGDTLQAQEAYRKITNQMALRLRNPESGLGLTGNTSDRDLKFLKESVPGLETSEAGNRLIIEMMRRVNLRKREVAIEAEKFAIRNGNLNGFSEHISKWADNNQLFDDKFRSKVSSASGNVRSFDSIEAAEAANLPAGTEILIGGRRAIVE